MQAVEMLTQSSDQTWQTSFLKMMPDIERRLRIGFRNLRAECREDAVEEALVHCVVAYHRLVLRGREQVATAFSLATFAVLQIRRGRLAVGHITNTDPLSRYARYAATFKVLPLQDEEGGWIDEMVDARRANVADQVAAKMDFVSWLGTLQRRTRQIAMDLAQGSKTHEVADKYRLSHGRISQLRRELFRSWARYQSEPTALAVR